MPRDYDASRRRKAAEQTRQDILRAALKLHWDGVTAYEPLAREAGCSVATVRKHFPTRETLFRNCTRAFAETLEPPDLEQLAEIPNSTARAHAAIAELCRLHEAMFGYAWLGEQLRDRSPTLDGEMSAYASLINALADLVTPAGSSRAGLVRGMLDFLTYRALRLSGQLSAESAAEALIAVLTPIILARDEPHGPSSPGRTVNHDFK